MSALAFHIPRCRTLTVKTEAGTSTYKLGLQTDLQGAEIISLFMIYQGAGPTNDKLPDGKTLNTNPSGYLTLRDSNGNILCENIPLNMLLYSGGAGNVFTFNTKEINWEKSELFYPTGAADKHVAFMVVHKPKPKP